LIDFRCHVRVAVSPGGAQTLRDTSIS